MRQLNRSVVRFGRNERNFSEAEIAKLTKPRDHDGLTSLTFDPNFFPNTTRIRIEAAAEPEPQRTVTKGAWA